MKNYLTVILLSLASVVSADIDLQPDMRRWTHEIRPDKSPHHETVRIESNWPVRPLSLTMKGPIQNAKILSDRTLDVSSMGAIVRQIIKPGMSGHEKMMACWRFINQHVRANPDAHPTGDTVQLLNSAAGGWCGAWAMSLETICTAAGLNAQVWEINGHVVTMVEYDNAWHGFCPMTYSYWLAPDNRTIAGPKQIAMTPWIMSRTVDTYGHRIGGEYDSLWPKINRPEATGGLGVNRKIKFARQDMRISLRKNETFERRWQPIVWEWYMGHKKEVLPFDKALGVSYKMGGLGHGILRYAPDLSDPSYRQDVAMESNILCNADSEHRPDGAALMPKLAGKPGVLVWHVSNPYPYLRAKVKTTFQRRTDNDRITVSISTDHGITFQPLWSATRTGRFDVEIDLMPAILEALKHLTVLPESNGSFVLSRGKYSYLVKVECAAAEHPADVGIDAIEFDNMVQLVTRSLPAIGNGDTQVNVTGSMPTSQRASLAYLAEEDIFSNRNPMQGDPLTLRLRIKNHGNVEARDVPVQFFRSINGVERKEFGPLHVVPAVAPGRSVTIQQKVDTSELAGELAIEAVIDPDSTIDETNGENNSFWSVISIRERPILALNDTYVSFEPAEPKRGDRVRISATVRNMSGYPRIPAGGFPAAYRTGTNAHDVEVKFFDGPAADGKLIGSVTLPRIRCGEFAIAEVDWDTTNLYGARQINVQVDPDGKIPSKPVPTVTRELVLSRAETEARTTALGNIHILEPTRSAMLTEPPAVLRIAAEAAGASNVQFQISRDDNFQQIVAQSDWLPVNGGGSNWSLDGATLDQGRWFWRARVRDQHYVGPWQTAVFRIGKQPGWHQMLRQEFVRDGLRDVEAGPKGTGVMLASPCTVDEDTLFYAGFDNGLTADHAAGRPTPLLGLPALVNGYRGKAMMATKPGQFVTYQDHIDWHGRRPPRTTFYNLKGELETAGVNINPREGTVEMWFQTRVWLRSEGTAHLYCDLTPTHTRLGRRLMFINKRNVLEFSDSIRRNGKLYRTVIEYDCTKMDPDAWHHVAGTWDDKEIRLFIDGKLVATQAKNPSYESDAMTTFLLGSSKRGINQLQGLIDDFRISRIARKQVLERASHGTVTSPTILLPEGKRWQALNWQTETPPGTAVRLNVFAVHGDQVKPIAGLSGLEQSPVELELIPSDVRAIVLRAELTTTDSSQTPHMTHWEVTWK